MNLFDLMATISLETDDYDKGISHVQSGAGDAEDAMNSIDSASTNAEAGLDDVGSAASDAGSDLDSLASDADSAGSDLDSLASDADSAGSDLDALGSDADSAGSDLDSFGADADSAGSDLDSMASDADDAASSLDDLADSADDTADSISALGDASGDAVGDLSSLGGTLGGTLTSGSNEASNAVSAVSSVVGQLASGNFIGAAISAAASIGTGIYNMAQNSQEASAIIAQGTGATGEELQEMAQIAKSSLADVSLASETNLQDVSATLAELNTRFGLTGDELQDTTTMMTDFAAITGQDGVAATDAIADTMAKWNISAEDMPGLLDDITTAAQYSGQSASDLEKALSNNSAAFQQLGYDTEDALGFISAYSLAGGDASDMTAILKGAVDNLSEATDDVPGSFQAAIEAIQNADDASEALNAEVGDTGLTVQDVFGTKNANKMISALQSEQFSLEDATAALEDNDGAMEQTAKDSVTFSDKVSGAWNTMKNGCSKAWQGIKGIFSGSKKTATDAGDGIVEGLEESEAGVAEAAEGLGNAVIDGVNDTLETHSPSKVMMETGGNVSEGLSEGMSDMPDKISGTLGETLSSITEFGDSAVSTMSSSAEDAVSAMDSGYSQSPSTVGNALTSAFSKITNWASDSESEATSSSGKFISNIKNGLSSLSKTVQSPLTTAFGNTTSWSGDMTKTATSSGTGFVSNISTAMNDVGSKVLTKLKQVNTESSSWSSGLTSDFNGMGGNVMQGLINGMDKMVQPLYSSIKSSLSGLVSKAKNALGIGSPSKVFRDEVGLMIGEGLALGIEDSEDEVDSAMDDLMDATDVDDKNLSPDFGLSATTSSSLGEQIETFNDNFDQLFELFGVYFPLFAAETEIRLDSGELVGATAKKMNKALGKLGNKESRMG